MLQRYWPHGTVDTAVPPALRGRLVVRPGESRVLAQASRLARYLAGQVWRGRGRGRKRYSMTRGCQPPDLTVEASTRAEAEHLARTAMGGPALFTFAAGPEFPIPLLYQRWGQPVDTGTAASRLASAAGAPDRFRGSHPDAPDS